MQESLGPCFFNEVVSPPGNKAKLPVYVGKCKSTPNWGRVNMAY